MKRNQQLQELRERTPEQLAEELKEARTRLFQDRVRYATRSLDNAGPIRAGQKRVARILTLMRERELAAEGAPNKRKRS
jgi:large subunit ribosomal protein L29